METRTEDGLSKVTYAYGVASQGKEQWDWEDIQFYSKIILKDWENKKDILDENEEGYLIPYAIRKWDEMLKTKKLFIEKKKYEITEVYIESGSLDEINDESMKLKQKGFQIKPITRGYGKYGLEKDVTYTVVATKKVNKE